MPYSSPAWYRECITRYIVTFGVGIDFWTMLQILQVFAPARNLVSSTTIHYSENDVGHVLCSLGIDALLVNGLDCACPTTFRHC